MTQLEEAREIIDRVDRAVAPLFEERIRAARLIAAYKKENSLPTRDPAREQAILDRNSGYIKDEALRPYYRIFMQNLFDVMSQYQDDLNS